MYYKRLPFFPSLYQSLSYVSETKSDQAWVREKHASIAEHDFEENISQSTRWVIKNMLLDKGCTFRVRFRIKRATLATTVLYFFIKGTLAKKKQTKR